MITIGLTGGIASGKSTAAQYLQGRGALMIDADKLGHRVYEPGRDGFRRVVAAFGEDIVGEDGQIDRKVLGGKVFGDQGTGLKRLTDIVWPEILALAREEIDAARQQGVAVAVLEAAVLFEAGWDGEVDEIWVVTVDRDTAIERAMQRDGVDAAAVQARIDAQISNEERAARAHRAFDNSGTEADLIGQLDSAWAALGVPAAADQTTGG